MQARKLLRFLCAWPLLYWLFGKGGYAKITRWEKRRAYCGLESS